MKTIELNRMGLTPINDLEMNEINGGGFWRDLYHLLRTTGR